MKIENLFIGDIYIVTDDLTNLSNYENGSKFLMEALLIRKYDRQNNEFNFYDIDNNRCYKSKNLYLKKGQLYIDLKSITPAKEYVNEQTSKKNFSKRKIKKIVLWR